MPKNINTTLFVLGGLAPPSPRPGAKHFARSPSFLPSTLRYPFLVLLYTNRDIVPQLVTCSIKTPGSQCFRNTTTWRCFLHFFGALAESFKLLTVHAVGTKSPSEQRS